MKYPKQIILLVCILWATLLSPYVYASPVTVSISPTTQAVQQGNSATFTVSLSSGAATSFLLSASGLSGSGSFSPNPVATPPGGGSGSGTSTLSIPTTGASGLYCPGSYSFTVTASNATDGPLPSPPGAQNPETGSATATLTVIQVGPPLSVTVATDRQTYTVGDTVTILISSNRPAQGRLTISPPGAAPSVFDYQLLSGSYTITKTLTASSVGHWTLSFQANDYCSGLSSAQAAFDVTPNTYDVSLSLSGVPSQYSAGLQVDGASAGTIGGGQIQKFTFKLNTSHTVSVDQYISGDTGVRFYCAQNTLNVTSTGSFTFSYQTQYQFTVQTDPNGITQVGGGGWFPAGTPVQTTQAPQTVPGGTGTQYAFKGWQLNGTPATGNPLSITLDKPYMAVAKYSTQYELVVNSPYGNPQGAGFYDAGTPAQFSVTTPSGFPLQQVFVQWQGDYTGTQPQGSITMTKPETVTALWTTSYLPLIAILVVAAAIVGGLLFWRSKRKPPPETKPTPPPAETTSASPAAGTVKCSKCGTENSAGQNHCTECGQSLKD